MVVDLIQSVIFWLGRISFGFLQINPQTRSRLNHPSDPVLTCPASKQIKIESKLKEIEFVTRVQVEHRPSSEQNKLKNTNFIWPPVQCYF